MHMVHDISDWVVVMAEGRIVAEGPPAAVMQDQAVIDAYLGAHHDTADDLLEEDGPAVEAEAERRSRGRGVAAAERAGPRPPRNGRAGPAARGADIVAGYLPGVNILHGCTLEVCPGELVGIIGPNGAGKSTLLKALFGLVPVRVRPGDARRRGHHRPARRTSSSRRGVGFVPQTNNVFPSLTVEENMRMGVFLRPKTFAERLEFITDLFPAGRAAPQRAGACRVVSGRWSPWPGRS